MCRRSGTEERNARADPSELEKYYTLGLSGQDDASKRRSFANEESEYSDTFSETSSSIYSESVDPALEPEEMSLQTDPVELASSRLEKYFLTNFLGLDGAQYPFAVAARGENSSDGSVSVGSDSEGHVSPEQRRRKVFSCYFLFLFLFNTRHLVPLCNPLFVSDLFSRRISNSYVW